MSVVHLWRSPDDEGEPDVWCGAVVLDGAGEDQIDQVTCPVCLGMASDFGGACLSRLRELNLEAQAKFPDEETLRRWFHDGEPVPPGRYVVTKTVTLDGGSIMRTKAEESKP